MFGRDAKAILALLFCGVFCWPSYAEETISTEAEETRMKSVLDRLNLATEVCPMDVPLPERCECVCEQFCTIRFDPYPQFEIINWPLIEGGGLTLKISPQGDPVSCYCDFLQGSAPVDITCE